MSDSADEDYEPRLRLVVASDTALANVLSVSRAAVYQAERRGRIAREADGTWEVLAVVNDWRRFTNPSLQRDVPAWLNPGQTLTDELIVMLARRVRAHGGHVLEDEGGGAGWHALPAVSAILRAGTPLSYFAGLELAQTVNDGEWWYDWSLQHDERIARRLGVADVEAVRTALHAEMRETLATLSETDDE